MKNTKSASSLETAGPNPLLVLVALLAVYIIWGSTYLGIRLAIASIPPFFMAGTRYLAAGGLMFLFALCRGAKMPSLVEWRDALILGGCLLLVGNGGVTFAEQYVPSGTAALLVATVPVFLTIFAWLTKLGPRPSGMICIALLLGLLGVSILSRPASSPGNQIHWYMGIVALLAAAAVWAGGSLYSRKAAHPSSPIVGVGIQMICGGALLLLVSISTGEFGRVDLGRVTGESFLAWLYLVVVGAIIAFTAYVWLTRVISPALLGTYAFVNPVVAVLLGWAIAGETLDSRTISGAAVIVVAVVIIVVFANRTKRPVGAAPSGKVMAGAGNQ
ncbi:MAG: EamA family transporter [Verrucomicrobia bacterium]|nr:EamA family transporter [Verrucomicrobiota bacterium]MBV8486207.1 EamA family transporter [Verrucomicrobiota bacterium]